MKRDPRLVGLSREHHHALVLAARLRKTGSDPAHRGALQAELLRSFREEIEPHFRVEEKLLLPALRALGGDSLAMVRRTEQDHAWLREGAARIAAGKMVDLTAWGKRMHQHVRFEERELFAHAQAMLPDAVLERIHDARPAGDRR